MMKDLMKYNLQFFAEGEGESTTDTGAETGAESTVSGTEGESTEAGKETTKTFTQEDVDKIVAKRLERERAKLEKEFSTRVDKGVEDKMTEAEKLSKMSATEKREYELNKRIEELEAKEKDYQLRELQSTARGLLTELGYDGESVKALEGFIKYENADSTSESIKNLDKVIKSIVDKRVETEVNARLVTHTKPPVGKQSNVGGNTWSDYVAGKCTYKQYLASKNK